MMIDIRKRLYDVKRVRSFLISYYIIGFLGLALPITKPFFEQLTGLTIIISFFLMMIYHKGWNFRFIFVSLFIICAGFFVEVVGVKTGDIFGTYTYHGGLGPKWLGVPVIMGVNWLMIVYAIYHMTLKVNMNPVIRPMVNAMLMVIYDLALEPVAIGWNMWTWEEGSVPASNYIAWFFISFLFFAIMQVFNIKYKNRIATLVIALQFVLFLLLNVVRII